MESIKLTEKDLITNNIDRDIYDYLKLNKQYVIKIVPDDDNIFYKLYARELK